MSLATPETPLLGWWIMIRQLGSPMRLPRVPAASSQAPIEAAWPTQIVAMSGRTYCIVS